MPADPLTLNERAQLLLKTLVERYIVEGQPVGSRALSKYSGLDLSPATIRNVNGANVCRVRLGDKAVDAKFGKRKTVTINANLKVK